TTGTFGLNSGILAFLFPHPDVALNLAARCGLARQGTECESVADPDLERSLGSRVWRPRDGAVRSPVEHSRPGDHVARGEMTAVDAHALRRPGAGEVSIEAEQRGSADDKGPARVVDPRLGMRRHFLGD